MSADYRIVDSETLLHTPCNSKVPVGMYILDTVSKAWIPENMDSLQAAIMSAVSHELECECGETGTTEAG